MIRRRNLSGTGVEIFLQEEQSAGTETTHNAEDVGFLVLGETEGEARAKLQFCDLVQDQASAGTWHAVTSTGFEWHFDEWDYQDGIHAARGVLKILDLNDPAYVAGQPASIPLTGAGSDYGVHPAAGGLTSLFNSGEPAFVANVGTLVHPTTLAGYNASGSPYDNALNGDGSYKTNIAGKRLKAFDDITNYTYQHLLDDDHAKVVKRARANEGLVGAALTAAAATGVDFDNFFVNAQSSLGDQLKSIAKLIAGRTSLGNSRQIFFASIGGFDTHQDQLDAQTNLLGELGNSLKAFNDTLKALGVNDNVVTITHSDLTRTLTPNGQDAATAGSDHGWGGHQIVVGDPVPATIPAEESRAVRLSPHDWAPKPQPEIWVLPEAVEIAGRPNTPDTTPQDDLETLDLPVTIFRKSNGGANPAGGENDEIVSQLTGHNDKGFAVLPPKDPVISAIGQLLDRWGRPYYFHPVSRNVLGLRSAGSDGKFFTADDVVLNQT